MTPRAHTIDHSSKRWLASIRIVVTAATLLLGQSAAQAHPEYPPVVDQSLGLKTSVEKFLPPTGCQLCHTSSSGGTQLASFGSLLVSTYGLSNDAVSAHVPSLQQALINLEEGDPEAVADLRAGKDPNADPAVFSSAPPTPQYGCSVAARGRAQSSTTCLLVGALVVLVVAGLRRRRLPWPRRRLRRPSETW